METGSSVRWRFGTTEFTLIAAGAVISQKPLVSAGAILGDVFKLVGLAVRC